MANLPIVHHPADILEVKCDQVFEFNRELHELLDDMYETMISEDGVGLAAPQVGISSQVAIVEIDDEEGLIELINPKIISQSGEQTDVEGCLSFPGLYGTVSRSYTVIIKAQDRYGEEFKLKANDFLARAIQHELDHLNGVLFTSKVIKYVNEEDLEGSEDK
ncbi:peptide deformylase [Lederbergia citrea]|uniref:Peptide deformylase n=1 Tax=Lederbergia citrea TaxID=2833581 RepID=A0A942Z2K8_9BACI|nr:peptide deformylase [Lederbergia citrea]MBS4177173.1 peptide deformylase [Lederbergia citrea]MBS4203836.1 peptide deformylase [Lederbergia citrea]MBS4221579.1 peptide deformylase [Lederbergia citrea]